MIIEDLAIDGVKILTPRLYSDDRGYFCETWSAAAFARAGLPENFVQDNHAASIKAGTVRGLHYQKAPHAQGKLVRCMTGKVIDIVVDIRKDSPTFGQHEKFILDSATGNMLYVPAGFAHGFVALEETIFVYKCTDYWHKASESGIIYNDADLNIDWEEANPIVSSKDLLLPRFSEI